MNTLVLAAPDFTALGVESLNSLPPALWVIGSQSLAAHWLDHASRMGFKRVRIHATDRPAALRTELGNAEFWSLEIEIDSRPAPQGCVVMLQLPFDAPVPTPDTRAAIIRWWMDLNRRWLDQRDGRQVSLDREIAPRVWLGPRAEIAPGARLCAPCWIGAGTRIGPGCVVGPGTLIGPGCVVERDTVIENALVEARTFIGANLDLRVKIVSAGRVLDVLTGAMTSVVDRFLITPLGQVRTRVSFADRLLAIALWVPAHLLALGAGPARREHCRLTSGTSVELVTRPRGPLLGRRADWLRHVIAGRIHLVGIPPQATGADLPPESRSVLHDAPVGVFGLSDTRSTAEGAADHAMHVLFQAAVPAEDMNVRRQLFRLMLRSA